MLAASDLGMLASLNRSMLDVHRKPQVAIVATGDELVDIDQIPTGAQIVNSKAPSRALAGAIQHEDGSGAPTILKIARDTHRGYPASGFTEAVRFDVVFSTGGVSVGPVRSPAEGRDG